MDFSVLRLIRKHKKITLSDMASRVNITPAYLSLIERNKRNLRITTIENICKELEDIQLLLTFNKSC